MLHEYKVCMKTLEKSVDITHLLREAYFIMEAGGHESIPHLFGIIKSWRSIIMSYHSVDGEHLSMYDACSRCDSMEHFPLCQVETIYYCSCSSAFTLKKQEDFTQ